MRVLLFRWLCDTGGVSTSLLLLQRELTRRGVACEFWFCKGSNRLADFEAAGPTTVGPLHHLAEQLRLGRFDILQMTASDPAAPLLAALAGPARVVVTGRGALAEGWDRRTCFAYTAVSEAMAQLCQPYTDLEVEVIRNGVDLERFAPVSRREGGAPIVAFVGRTTAVEKDFPRFTRIAAHLQARGARIWVADPHEASWDAFKTAGATPVDVERWERVPHAEMPQFYRNIAASGGALLVPSRVEGFGNVAVEAAACGATTIATDLLGLRESVIAGTTGTHFPVDADDVAVADLAWSWMMQQPDPAVCAAGASSFAASRMTDQYLSLYHRQEQRPATSAGSPPSGPARDVLLAHLVQQREWRARVNLTAAEGFSSHGRYRAAFRAIRMIWQDQPGQLLSMRGARLLLLLMLRCLRHPGRLAIERPLLGSTTGAG